MIRSYRVVGRYHKIFGVPYGGTFERDLSERQERFLIEAGHIAPVPKKNPSRRAVVAVKSKPEQPAYSVSLVKSVEQGVV